MATIYDVARVAGVSTATVSRVFRTPETVSSRLRHRVKAAAVELGYRPNRVAQALAEGKSRAIGLLLPPDYGNVYFTMVMATTERLLVSLGRELVVASYVDRDPELWVERVQGLLDRQLDGVLLFGESSQFAAGLERGVLTEIPVVGLGSWPCSGLPVVGPDEERAGFVATEHLIDLGHRRIAFLGLDWEMFPTWRRESGYVSALRGAGLEPVLEATSPEDPAESRLATFRLIEDHPDVTAIMGVNDGAAAGAARALHEMGIRVPDEVSVIGFDNVPMCQFMCPSLSSVDLSAEATAAEAVRRLLQAVEHPGEGAPSTRTLLQPRLVARESTAQAPVDGRHREHAPTVTRREGCEVAPVL
jgi:DNA-binding LacI/PurR family transcriptional regulator